MSRYAKYLRPALIASALWSWITNGYVDTVSISKNMNIESKFADIATPMAPNMAIAKQK